MKKITVEDDWALVSEDDEIELNPVEALLKNAGEKGLSYKQLSFDFDKKSMKYYIFTSKYIEDTPGILHGSLKSKIKVVRYTEKISNYFDRNKKQKITTSEVDPSSQQ